MSSIMTCEWCRNPRGIPPPSPGERIFTEDFWRSCSFHRVHRRPYSPLKQRNLADDIIFNPVKPFDTQGYSSDLFLGTHYTAGSVALKRFRQRAGAGDLETLARLEVNIWKQLKHDRILKFLGKLESDGFLYLVSPFMKNGTLSGWIKSANPFGRERLRLIRELTDALVYMHTGGIVHGDVKANNVLLSDDFHVQLCDFGLAKPAGSQTDPILKGTGTFRWQSPELVSGQTKTFKSDVYAFAMTIVEVLTGQIPFPDIKSVVIFTISVYLGGARPARVPLESTSQDGASQSYACAWDVAELCWHSDPNRRISMREAAALLKLQEPIRD